jgi:DNA-binding CsgD family transcriptional regulator
MLPITVVNDLIGSIYEAGAFPERWPDTLHKLGVSLGARGGNLIRSTAGGLELLSSRGVAEVTEEFAHGGWNQHNSRVARLLGRAGYAGFLTDSDLHSEEELATLPMYAEFLNPRGAAAGAATIVQGARDDAMIVALEAFASHPASREAVPLLDQLRPHMARAAVLSTEIQSARVGGMVEAFNTLDVAIGLLDRKGKLVAASRRFASHADDLLVDSPTRLRMVDETTDRRFAAAIADLDRHHAGVSIALRNRDKMGVAVLHLVPARHDARELFSHVSMFAVIGNPGNDLLPGADIISALFDLTPAEARVARGIAQGNSPAELARQLGLSPETIRTQLKRVFAKTSTKRQSDLSRLISKLV